MVSSTFVTGRQTDIHTDKRTHTHANICICTHALIHTHVHIREHTYVDRYIYKHIHICTHTCTGRYVRIYYMHEHTSNMHTHVHTYKCTHTHICMCKYIHTCTCTHIHTHKHVCTHAYTPVKHAEKSHRLQLFTLWIISCYYVYSYVVLKQSIKCLL